MKQCSFVLNFMFVLCLLIPLVSDNCHAETPVIPLEIINGTLSVDGMDSDTVWKNIEWHNGFMDSFGRQSATPAIRFKVATNGETLFVLIESDNPDISKFPKKKLQRDKLSFDETLEVFIAPDANSPEYFHFAFDPAGNIYDNVANALATDNDYDINYKVKVYKTKWFLEMALPVNQLGLKRIRPGMMLDFNIGRVSKTGTRASAWSATGSSFHMRNNFGRLVAGSLNAGAELQLKQLETQIAKNHINANAVLKKNLAKLNFQVKDIKTISQWRDFQKNFYCISVEVNKQIAGVADKLRVWNCFPWVLPDDNFIAPESDDVSEVKLSGLKGEFLTLALGAVNLSEKAVCFRVECSKIKYDNDEKFLNSHDIVRIAHVVSVVVQGGAVTRDALSDMNIETVIDFRPHRNEIIWLMVDTRKLPAGKYSFTINFCPTVKREFSKTVKIDMDICEPAFPERGQQWIPLSHAYYYPQGNPVSGAGRRERYCEAVWNDLYDHYQNVYKTDSGAWSVVLDEKGTPVGEPDFSHLDELSAKLKKRFGGLDGVYFVTMPHPTRIPKLMNEVLGGEKFGPKIMDSNLKWFVKKFNERLKYNGIKKENFLWYAVDEPSYELAQMAKLFYSRLVAIDPEQQICATFYPRTELRTIGVLLPIINLWIPRSDSTAEQFTMIKSQGRKPQRLVMYNVCSRITPAYRGYLLRNYEALRDGYSGGFFWAYDDVGRRPDASMWNDFTSERSHYSCIYDGTDRPQSSVRWEAWRQGMQDWILYAWLKKLGNESKNLPLRKMALELTEEAPASIMRNPQNYQLPGKYREQVHKLIKRLCKVNQK